MCRKPLEIPLWVVTDTRDGSVLGVSETYTRVCQLVRKKYPNIKECHQMATAIKTNC